MRPSIPRTPGLSTATLPTGRTVTVITGVEFLLSMVEAHRGRNGNGNGSFKMDSRAQQELKTIEQQIARLQAVASEEDEDTRKEIQRLNHRIDALRTQVTSRSIAWEKTELARHLQRPYTLDYIERVFTDWS